MCRLFSLHCLSPFSLLPFSHSAISARRWVARRLPPAVRSCGPFSVRTYRTFATTSCVCSTRGSLRALNSFLPPFLQRIPLALFSLLLRAPPWPSLLGLNFSFSPLLGLNHSLLLSSDLLEPLPLYFGTSCVLLSSCAACAFLSSFSRRSSSCGRFSSIACCRSLSSMLPCTFWTSCAPLFFLRGTAKGKESVRQVTKPRRRCSSCAQTGVALVVRHNMGCGSIPIRPATVPQPQLGSCESSGGCTTQEPCPPQSPRLFGPLDGQIPLCLSRASCALFSSRASCSLCTWPDLPSSSLVLG